MFITKKIALKKTRVHSDDGFLDKAYIPKGTVYYQINNGTIGRGARSYNMSEKAIDAKTPKRVWTMVDGDDGMYLEAGYHLVNRIYYIITNEEWTSADEVYRFEKY
jgi:hypothetical protein